MQTQQFDNGNRARFQELAIPQMKTIYNHAVYMTKDVDRAKDLLQDTFLKAYVFWNKFEQGTNIGGWLYCIMKNTYINTRKAKTREPLVVDSERIEELSDSSAGESPEFLPDLMNEIRDVFEDEIVTELEAIPEKFRNVVILRDVLSWSYEEIAESMNCSLGTVRSRLHRARRMLGSRLRNFAVQNGYVDASRCKRSKIAEN